MVIAKIRRFFCVLFVLTSWSSIGHAKTVWTWLECDASDEIILSSTVFTVDTEMPGLHDALDGSSSDSEEMADRLMQGLEDDELLSQAIATQYGDEFRAHILEEGNWTCMKELTSGGGHASEDDAVMWRRIGINTMIEVTKEFDGIHMSWIEVAYP